MKGSLKCLGQPNQAAYADTEIKLEAVTEPEPLQHGNPRMDLKDDNPDSYENGELTSPEFNVIVLKMRQK
jgi:hypothetical protein